MPLRLLVFLLLAVPAPAQLVLTECMASNRTGLTDDDGMHADWIEVFNAGRDPADLLGYLLTDDKGHRWTFPAVSLAGRSYLLLFLSGKDRRNPGQPLHANFRLGRGGGRLALRSPIDRGEVSCLEYPRQHDDFSFGRAQAFEARVLAGPCGAARYLAARGTPSRNWKLPEFDDGTWTEGFGGFGFAHGERSDILEWIGSDLGAAMRGKTTSAFFRYEFAIDDPSEFSTALIRVRCVGGFVAWLNGTEIARANVPDELTPDSKARTWREGADPRLVHELPVTAFADLLRRGENILAVRSLTTGRFAPDHLLMAELIAYRPGPLTEGAPVSFASPTPGRPNGNGHSAIAKKPRFVRRALFSTGPAQVEPKKPGDGIVRFTTDGSPPTPASPVLDGPITLERSARIRARRFVDGREPSPIASAHFTRIARDLANYGSDLPMLVISTHGAPVATKEWVPAHVHAIATGDDGRCTLSDEPQVSTHAGIRLRGSSTLNLPKRSYAIELRKENGRDRDVALFGLPKAADWVLYAPYNYDQSHLRNALCYELARRIGLPSPRWRFVELFVDTDGGEVTRDDYKGLYLLVERIAPSMERVEIDTVDPGDRTEPAITGGYLLKIDRPGPGDLGFSGGGERLQFFAPKEREITDPQRAWLKGWFDAFGSALSGEDFADREKGYAAFIDVDNFIDYHFFHEYTKNPDAYTLSTYMHKPRGGRLRMGPIWDFDRAMRTNDAEYWVNRGPRPEGWTADNYHGWWGVLFRDPAFRARYRARGRRWLETELSVPSVHALVREIAARIARAEERDRRRWPIARAGEWDDELIDLERWIADRTLWFREELLEVPIYTSDTGRFDIPFVLSMDNANDRGTIYYTLDGADPRLADGQISPHAKPYEGPIRVDRDLQVRSRVRVGELWSREMEGAYVKSLPKLVISELMFKPEQGHRAEFVELWNHGDEPIDLRGLSFAGPIHFPLGTGRVRELGPNERLVVVNDETTFRDLYDCLGIRVAGEFLGDLDNTEGRIRIIGPVGELVHSTRYVDSWIPETDGKKRSFVLRAPRRIVERAEDWTASDRPGGTPGR